jgi:6-pyruvoyl-tetrahydropterin synthase
MKSTIFLNQLTVIDHALVGPDGKIHGGSWLPDFFVTGEVIGDEAVVVDFSTIKKDIKKIIDDQETGFDHKLIFIKGWSKGEILEDGDNLNIVTSSIGFKCPRNAVKVIDTFDTAGELKNHVEAKLKEMYPHINISVDVTNKLDRVHGLSDNNQYFFRYVHGLKSSTSWGCGNLAHGHLSFIEPIGGDGLSNKLVLSRIANGIDDVMFIHKGNIISQDEDHLTFGYDMTECGRGPFEMTINTKAVKYAILDTETTIEYLVEFIKQNWGAQIAALGIQFLLVSEGLSKGAVLNLQS